MIASQIGAIAGAQSAQSIVLTNHACASMCRCVPAPFLRLPMVLALKMASHLAGKALETFSAYPHATGGNMSCLQTRLNGEADLRTAHTGTFHVSAGRYLLSELACALLVTRPFLSGTTCVLLSPNNACVENFSPSLPPSPPFFWQKDSSIPAHCRGGTARPSVSLGSVLRTLLNSLLLTHKIPGITHLVDTTGLVSIRL